jgi:hypothetical protein
MSNPVNQPEWKFGEKVWVGPSRVRAIVVQQIYSYVEDEGFWGDVIVRYENGTTGVEKNWQIMRINE